MKRLMYKISGILVLLFISMPVLAQDSDYARVKAFEKEYIQLYNRAINAMSIPEIDSISADIISFELNFGESEELINQAIFPETFIGKILSLKQNLQQIEHRVLVMENQQQRLSDLTSQLSLMNEELAVLRKQSDSLKEEILASGESEVKLSNLLATYRKNLEQRDALIMNLVDSLMKIPGEGFSEGTLRSTAITKAENPVRLIEQLLQESRERLNSEIILNTEDYIRMYALHRNFDEMWRKTGRELTKAYSGKTSDETFAAVQTQIEDWGSRVSEELWRSIYESLEGKEITVSKFNNPESFFTALNTYIDTEMKQTSESSGFGSNPNTKSFENLKSFWNSFVDEKWIGYIVDDNSSSLAQITLIDRKLNEWESSLQPISVTLYILLGISTLIILGMGVILVKKWR